MDEIAGVKARIGYPRKVRTIDMAASLRVCWCASFPALLSTGTNWCTVAHDAQRRINVAALNTLT